MAHINSITGAELHLTRVELEMLHNVLYRVQLGTSGYGRAASDVLGALDRIFGDTEESDHYVEMYEDGYGSLYWTRQNY